MDKYESIRSLPFPALASALGLDLTRFKTRKGGEYYGSCPVHNPKNNSTSFSYAADGKFNCFSCGAKGRGGIDLTKLVKNVGFKEATELLGAIPPPQPKQEPVEAPVNAAGVLQPLAKDTWRKFAVACPWLEQRIPDVAVRERYGVFCYNNPARRSAYSNRVMLPVRDIGGNLYGYLGRATETGPDIPKYLFPRSLPKSQFLFGAHELSRPDTPHSGHLPLKVVYLVESPFCVMKFAAMGLPAVSPFGWSVADSQIELLATLTRGVVYLPDRDKNQQAGESASLLARRLWLRFPPLPAGVDDPEQMTREQVLAL